MTDYMEQARDKFSEVYNGRYTVGTLTVLARALERADKAEAKLQALKKARAADALEPSGDVVDRLNRGVPFRGLPLPKNQEPNTANAEPDLFAAVALMAEAATAITTLQAELASARQSNDTALAMAMQAGADAERGRIVDWLNSQPETLHHDDIANAIEARDWSKP